VLAKPGSEEEICLFNAIKAKLKPKTRPGTAARLQAHHRRDRRNHHRRACA